MKTILFTTTLIISLFMTKALYAQDTPQALLEKFFTIYETSGPNAAVNYVFSTNEYLNQNQEALTNIKNQLNSLLQLVGDYHGYEFISNKQMGDSFMLYNIMVKYARQPIQFTFILYRPATSWHFQNFMYDPNLDDVLEEMSKLSMR